MSDEPTSNTWGVYVHSAAFDKECAAQSKRLLSSSGGFERSEHFKFWGEDGSSRVTSVGSSSHIVPELKTKPYCFGTRGCKHLGPKLIYRTSRDDFTPPPRPTQDIRVIKLLPVYDHEKLSQDSLWDTLGDEVVKLRDAREIQLTWVDLAHFRWEEQDTNGSSEKAIAPITIWIGALPDSLTGNAAFESSNDILQFLKKHCSN